MSNIKKLIDQGADPTKVRSEIAKAIVEALEGMHEPIGSWEKVSLYRAMEYLESNATKQPKSGTQWLAAAAQQLDTARLPKEERSEAYSKAEPAILALSKHDLLLRARSLM